MMGSVETFVIRLWVPAERDQTAEDADATALHGIVLHPASGVEIPFTGDDELLGVLRRHGGRTPGALHRQG